jgi:hypothetical protein
VSVDRQAGMLRRSLLAWPSREEVGSRAKDTIKGIDGRYRREERYNMKKIKSKLVTIVTDNVLGVGIVENKTLLACMLQERAGRPHRERKRKRWRCDNSKGTARTCDRSATIV